MHPPFRRSRGACGTAAIAAKCSIMPLTNAEKRDLKARAQRLDPIVKLGHAGMTDAFLKSLDGALRDHGLVKVKFSDHKDEKKALAPQIAERTNADLVTRVGNVAVYYRKPAAVPQPSS